MTFPGRTRMKRLLAALVIVLTGCAAPPIGIFLTDAFSLQKLDGFFLERR